MKKKHCYKKRGSDIYRKSYYATFYLKLRQDFCISRSENGLYKVFAVKKKKKKKKYSWQTWLIAMHCSQKNFHFLTVSNGPISILSDIVITLRKSHETISVGYFWKITNACKRYFWDVSETSRNRHLFWDVFETS